MTKVHREHPEVMLFLDDGLIVSYYANKDPRNTGEADLTTVMGSSAGMLRYQKQDIPVIGKQEIKTQENQEITYIYKLKTISKNLYDEMNKAAEALRPTLY